MTVERRTDSHQAKVVDAAMRINTLWGGVSAWQYLLTRGIAPATAVRVLGKNGARRAGDPRHPAMHDALERELGSRITQRVVSLPAAPGAEAMPRTNLATANAVERAIELSATHGRHYAESLLRIYGLDTTAVMRVLFEPHRRRHRAPTDQ